AQQRLAEAQSVVRGGAFAGVEKPGETGVRGTVLMCWTRLGLTVLVLALASCAPRYLTPGPAVMAPTLLPVTLVPGDGTALALTVWQAKEEKAIILALHGFNDYGEAFAIPAKSFTENGISVYAIDQRGFGETPRRSRWPGDGAFLDDLSDGVTAIRA